MAVLNVRSSSSASDKNENRATLFISHQRGTRRPCWPNMRTGDDVPSTLCTHTELRILHYFPMDNYKHPFGIYGSNNRLYTLHAIMLPPHILLHLLQSCVKGYWAVSPFIRFSSKPSLSHSTLIIWWYITMGTPATEPKNKSAYTWRCSLHNITQNPLPLKIYLENIAWPWRDFIPVLW